jgi:hypothetical protein
LNFLRRDLCGSYWEIQQWNSRESILELMFHNEKNNVEFHIFGKLIQEGTSNV